ncbi:Rieske (2Fe-2S) protein [Alkalihalobacterium sp. APHAB7]|uniref:Rieske (2Fe-2S) protein n=1 Tax=Alkalihalobacterium sp. APHAB7 TaxID=3402081 RepID=UPI003AB0B1E3
MKQFVCKIEDIKPNGMKAVSLGKREVVVIRDNNDRFYAFRDFCPHQGTRLSDGRVSGTTLCTDKLGEHIWAKEGEVIACPWHRWEFDVNTGCSLFSDKTRIKNYKVVKEDDNLLIEL